MISWEDATETTLTHVDNTGLAINTNLEAATITEGGVAVHNNDQMDASSELLAIIDDETGSGLIVFGTTPTFTTSIVLTGADADPGAAGGTIVYDNAITDILDGGALRWNDTGAAGALGVRLLVDLDTDPSDDGFVVSYDATLDKFKMSAAGAGDILADGSVPFTGEVNFQNNAAAATFGAVGTDADVVLAFDAVTAQGSITYMEDEDRFDFDNDVDVIGDLTAGTIASDGALSGTTVTGTAKISTTATTEQLRLNYDATNYAAWTVDATGATTVVTVDSDGAAANLTFSPNGTIILTPATDVVGALTAGSVASDGAVSGTTLALTSTLTGVTDITAGSATTDSGPLTMIQGAQTGDPQVILDLTADANGDFSITTDTGDLSLVSAATAIISAAGENIIITGTSNTLTLTTGTATDTFDFGAIDVVANDLTMDGNLSVGANPADAGTGIRMSNNTVIEFEEGDGTDGEITALQVGADDIIVIGDANADGVTITPATTVSGVLTASTGITSDTAITFSDGATIDQSANNVVEITENSDSIQFAFDATDLGIVWSDGALNLDTAEDADSIVNITGGGATRKGELRVLSAGGDKYGALYHDDTDTLVYSSSGDIELAADADTDDYVTISTATNVTSISVPGSTGTVGTAAAEWDALYLNDSGVIYGENDQANTITSSATAWTFNQAIAAVDATFTGTTTVSTLTQAATATPTWTATDSDETADGTFDIKANATTADYAMLMRFYVDEGDGAGADGADDVLFMTINGNGTNSTASGTIEFERIGNFEMGLSTSNSTTTAGFVDFYEDEDEAGSNYVRVIAPVLASSYTLTLPTTDGAANEVLKTDGNGVTSWTSSGSGTAWDDLVLPDADETLNMQTYNTEWSWTATAPSDDHMFAFTAVGDFVDDTVVMIQQETGNPSDGELLALLVADNENNVDQLAIFNGSDESELTRLVEGGSITRTLASDGDAQWIFTTAETAGPTTADGIFEIIVGATPTADTDIFNVVKGTTTIFSVDEDGDIAALANVSGATYGSDATVSDAELLYINSLASNAQTQITNNAALVDTDDEIIAIINASPGTYIDVAAGGTGVGTLALNGVLYGTGATDVGVTAIGSAGQVLVVGADPFVPVFSSTLTGITEITGLTTPLTVGQGGTGATSNTPTNVTPVDAGGEAAEFYFLIADGATSDQVVETDVAMTYNPSTDTLTIVNLDLLGAPFPTDPGADRVLSWDDSATGAELIWDTAGSGDFLADGSVPMTSTLGLGAAALIDATGAVDIDIGSIDITDVTILTDGGADSLTIGGGTALDFGITFDASANDGAITFDESVGKFEFDSAILAPINQVAKSSAYTVGTDNAEEAYGSMIYNTGAVKYTLPSGVAGMSVCIQQVQGQSSAITIAVPSGDYIVYEGVRGTQEAGGDEADLASAGAATDKICLMAYDATDWYVVSSTGTWAE